MFSKYDVYTTVQSMYCYPDSDVLKNKLNIRDKAELKQAEEEFTAVKQLVLLQEPMKGRFTKTHLLRIHRFLFEDVYLFFIGKMQSFYQEHGGGFHIVEPKKIWKLYTSDLYRMDAYYRHFHYAFGNSLKNANDVLEDGLKHSTEFVEALYQNWFLRELTACWTNAAADDLATLGYISEIEKQRDFYKRYVAPASSKNTRAFVVISDALRYEVASELSERIVRNTKGTAELESMQAIFPSITKFGMAALLPGKSISVNDSMDVLVDGNSTRSTVERNTILNATPKASVAIQYNDLLNMKKDERRELVAGKDVIYIYHNSIDAIGDKGPTESKVFDACETAIQELSGILRIIVNELSGTNIFITADHGFLYNRFIESSENPVKIHLCDGETAFVFALAHCGVMGTLNRNRGTNEKASLNKQIQDWAKIIPFLCMI